MQLWTVIDGDVYLEEGEYVSERLYKDGGVYINKYYID